MFNFTNGKVAKVAIFRRTDPTDVRLTDKQIKIVKILTASAREMTGYEIAAMSDGEFKAGAVYAQLDSLESKGVVVSRFESVTEGVRRLPKRYVSLANGKLIHHQRGSCYESNEIEIQELVRTAEVL